MTKRLLLALSIVLSLSSLDLARTEAFSVQNKESQKEGDVNQDSSELAEASELSKRVVRLYDEKKYDEAIPAAKRALELREKALGENNPLVVSSLNNLALLYMAKGKYTDAETLYERVLAAQERLHGADSPKVADALENLAWSRYALGKVGQATDMFERALSIKEKSLGPLHTETSQSLVNLARLHEKQGRPEKSLPFYRRALDVKEKALGPNHREVGQLLDKYACALEQAGQDKDADEAQKRANAIFRDDEYRRKGISAATGLILKGRATQRPAPNYPRAAVQARITGRMVVEVTVDETGKVIDARAKCGPDIFAAASIEAARRWQFAPTTRDGKPVKVIGTITFNFVP